MALQHDNERDIPTNRPTVKTRPRRCVWRCKRQDGAFYYKPTGGGFIFIAAGLAGLGGVISLLV